MKKGKRKGEGVRERKGRDKEEKEKGTEDGKRNGEGISEMEGNVMERRNGRIDGYKKEDGTKKRKIK